MRFRLAEISSDLINKHNGTRAKRRQKMSNLSFLSQIQHPETIVTAITSTQTFPEFINDRFNRYAGHIELFTKLINESNSSAELLEKIRDPKLFKAHIRMPLLKLFRRCVSTVIDTEKSKKLANPTSLFIENYGHTFKDIALLKEQFNNMQPHEIYALTSLIGEYDDRGQQGYNLTDQFFSWFEIHFAGKFSIEGPRGAGKDIQLNRIFKSFDSDYPCDFIIKEKSSGCLLAIGFARYDSTRGGSQSDDRTGGNNDKVMKVHAFSQINNTSFKILFLSDGPGLTHKDTWQEACLLDGKLNDRVRVSTLKIAELRITKQWLLSNQT